MADTRGVLIVGGGTAGWLAAAYLARTFGGRVPVTLLESSGIGIIGVGEGAFPTMRGTLQFLGIPEVRFIREASATFKQGILFDSWLHAPGADGRRHRYLHPFEAPFEAEHASLVPQWLLHDPQVRPPFAAAMTIQHQVAQEQRAPKQSDEGDYAGPLNYAYHFDAARLADLLKTRAIELGVRHLDGRVTHVEVAHDGAIAAVHSAEQGRLAADFFLDCSGFRAELIERTLSAPYTSVRHQLFTDRALACKIPYDRPNTPIPSVTVAGGHGAGWMWDIGLQGARGIGCVYSSAHLSDEQAAETLRAHIGHDAFSARIIPFEPGYRTTPWIGNCVAVGLSGGFLEPLESTGIVLIEAAVAMIAELYPHHGPRDAPAARFNRLMTARYQAITRFLKLHYCLSRRPEPFWRDNVARSSIPDALQDLLEQWRLRPPSRFDFDLDVESFAFFNYQYVLYGMDFHTDLSPARANYADAAAADRLFARIQAFGERAARDLPPHRALIDRIVRGG